MYLRTRNTFLFKKNYRKLSKNIILNVSKNIIFLVETIVHKIAHTHT